MNEPKLPEKGTPGIGVRVIGGPTSHDVKVLVPREDGGFNDVTAMLNIAEFHVEVIPGQETRVLAVLNVEGIQMEGKMKIAIMSPWTLDVLPVKKIEFEDGSTIEGKQLETFLPR